MSTRLDLVLQKFPEHEDGIRLLASRDPSGNFKYLDWGAKMLASRQALAPEIADVLALFHQFAGRWLEPSKRPRSRRLPAANKRVHPDLYTYRPQDFAKLRDLLLKIKRSVDRKRRKRERLYHIEGAIETDVIYEASDLIVRHIKNKQASVHYGLGTKWCIAMRREGYFEDYESHNATFFFFERKTPIDDEFDKVALMVPRSGESDESQYATLEAFTSVDRRVDMMSLARVHGPRVFDIFRDVYERSERYPGSAAFHVYAGSATPEQLESTFASVVKGGLNPHETAALLESICCNDAAPQSLLEEIARRASAIATAAWKRLRHRRRRMGSMSQHSEELVRIISAALVIHSQTPADLRERLVKWLRQRHVDIDAIRRMKDGTRVAVSYRSPKNGCKSRRTRRRPSSVKALHARAQVFDRMAARMRKRARTLQRKLAGAKKKRWKLTTRPKRS